MMPYAMLHRLLRFLQGRKVCHALAALLVIGCFIKSASTVRLLHDSGSVLLLQDFAYNALVAMEFWSGSINTPWDFASQQNVLSHYFRLSSPQAMPVGITPSGITLLHSLVWLAGGDIGDAYRLYLSISCATILIGLVLLTKGASNERSQALCILSLGALFSVGGLRAIVLGQSSLFAFGGLFVIAALVLLPRPQSFWSGISAAASLCLISCKPLYVLLGILMFIATRRWRDLRVGVLGLFIPLSFFALRFGWAPLMMYLEALRQYMHSLPAYYSYGRLFSEIPTLAGYLSRFHPESVVIAVSRAVFLVLVVAALGAACWRGRRIQLAVPIALALCAGLIFSPYAGEYESILVVLPVMLRWRTAPRISAVEGAFFTTLVLLMCFPQAQVVGLSIKIAILGAVVLLELTTALPANCIRSQRQLSTEP